ncbi:phage tail length tape measure family protein, partial [Albimonas pacifica]
ATGMRQVGVASNAGAAQLGNLAAQFNDIGVMLAAGQSPLQLALQQGTQISQVLGPMGAGGAVRALGAAFLSVLNPVSLITIGTIAAGAAMFSWLREAGPAAIDLGEAIDEVDASIDAVVASTKRLSSGALDEMVAKYGAMTGELQAMLRAQDELARRTAFLDLLRAQQGIAAGIAEQFRDIARADSAGHAGRTAEGRLARTLGMSRAEIDEVAAAMERAKTAATPEGMAESWRQVYERVVEIYGGFQQLSSGQVTLKTEQVQFLEHLVASEDSARRLAGIDMASGVAKARAEATRFADEMARARDAAFDLGKSGAERLEDARIRAAYANDPVEQARQLGIKAMERAQAPIYAGLGARDVSAREDLAAQAEEYGDLEARAAAADEARRKLLATSRSGTREFDQERKAVESLLEQERTRLAVLRETDPVRKEVLSVSDRMTAATAKERKELQGL